VVTESGIRIPEDDWGERKNEEEKRCHWGFEWMLQELLGCGWVEGDHGVGITIEG
jgi:hypothetical protein